ncbi:MAG: hypothetical protein FDZ69_02065 [Deltaproteobacteria bacterium]|nr:MAG: hypothetical protein FDZ69_02065 [Deltaproteobacteria bacterium]
MIDYHCHLLPGLDDGPDSVDESLEMARALAAFGFREVHCTPHCIAGQYEIPPVEVREAVRRLQARLDQAGVALTLRSGMEYYLDDCFERFAANLLPLGESRVVLCEAPPLAPAELVSEMAGLIVVQGFVPLIAHPERSEVVWHMLRPHGDRQELPAVDTNDEVSSGPWWRRLFNRTTGAATDDAAPEAHHSSLIAQYAALPEESLFQANLGSFVGFYGPQPQRRAYELLQRGVYRCLASDLHEGRSAAALLDDARGKLDYNPALRKLGEFRAPQGQGGNSQLAFW